eukprot:3900882-Lingulodinium_polyedra.AAC.1
MGRDCMQAVPEDYIAFLLRVEQGRKRARDMSDKDIPQVYRRLCLGVRCKLMWSKTRSDMWWHEYNARGRVGQQYRMVFQTSYQR